MLPLMDAGPFHFLGAWAPRHSHIGRHQQAPAEQPQRTVGKAIVEAAPQKISSQPLLVNQKSKSACMCGGGPGFPLTDPAKGAIDCPRGENKTDSSGDDGETGSRTSIARAAKPGYSATPQLCGAQATSTELPTVAEVLRMAKIFLQPANALERQFYADCYRACQAMPSGRAGGESQLLPYLNSVPEVALRLSCLGHRVVLRRVVDSRQYWSKSMTNTFCYSVLPGTGIGYVLDPGFKEHFKAGCMSDRYRDIWECLPPLFVGPPAKLVQLVQALCAELQASFEAAGRQLPPWRTFSSSINRWMSPVFRDLPVPQRRSSSVSSSALAASSVAAGAVPSSSSAAVTAAAAAAAPAGSVGGSGSSGSGSVGVIPAAEAAAFLRACEELLSGTASARPGAAATPPTTAAPAAVIRAAASVAAAAAPTTLVPASGAAGSAVGPVVSEPHRAHSASGSTADRPAERPTGRCPGPGVVPLPPAASGCDGGTAGAADADDAARLSSTTRPQPTSQQLPLQPLPAGGGAAVNTHQQPPNPQHQLQQQQQQQQQGIQHAPQHRACSSGGDGSGGRVHGAVAGGSSERSATKDPHLPAGGHHTSSRSADDSAIAQETHPHPLRPRPAEPHNPSHGGGGGGGCRGGGSGGAAGIPWQQQRQRPEPLRTLVGFHPVATIPAPSVAPKAAAAQPLAGLCVGRGSSGASRATGYQSIAAATAELAPGGFGSGSAAVVAMFAEGAGRDAERRASCMDEGMQGNAGHGSIAAAVVPAVGRSRPTGLLSRSLRSQPHMQQLQP